MSIGRIPSNVPIDTEAIAQPEQAHGAPPAAGITRPAGLDAGAITADVAAETPPDVVPSAQTHRSEMSFQASTMKHRVLKQFAEMPGPLPNPASGPPGDLPGTISQSPSGPPAESAPLPENIPENAEPQDLRTAEEKAREDRLKEILTNVIQTKKESGEDVLDNIR